MRMKISHGMEKLAHLALAGPDHSRICMARGGHPKGRGEVHPLFAFSVTHGCALRLLPHNRPRPVGLDECHVRRFVRTKEFECLASVHLQNGSAITNL